jgi:Anaphase-promoting complex, subunit 10 (APC10)
MISVFRRNLFRAIVGFQPDTPSIEQLPLFEGSEKIEYPVEYNFRPPPASKIRSKIRSLFVKLFVVSFTLALAVYYRQNIINYVTFGDAALWPAHNGHHHDCNQQAVVAPMAAPTFEAQPLRGTRIGPDDRKNWGLTCSSEKTGNKCDFLKDEDTETFWQTDDTKAMPNEGHSVEINLNKVVHVLSIAMTPVRPLPVPTPNPFPTGNPSHHKVQIKVKATDEWRTVAYGTWFRDYDGNLHSLSMDGFDENKVC